MNNQSQNAIHIVLAESLKELAKTKPIEKNRDFRVKQVGKTGPYTDRRYVGTRTNCWGDEYRVYQDYKYYKDEKGNRCDFFDVGGEYEE